MPFDGVPPKRQDDPYAQIVFSVRVEGGRFYKGKTANAVLVDKDNGIFVTTMSAVTHVSDPKWNKYRIYLPAADKYCQATVETINYDADLAYLRVKENISPYKEADLRKGLVEDNTRIKVVGHGVGGEWFEEPGRIMSGRSQYGINMPTLNDMWDAERRLFLPQNDRPKLYKNYLSAYMKREAQLVVGAAVTDDQERMAGIVSKSGARLVLAIPAHEIHAGLTSLLRPSGYFGPSRGRLASPRP